MKIIIEAEPTEITALVSAVQELLEQMKDIKNTAFTAGMNFQKGLDSKSSAINLFSRRGKATSDTRQGC